MEDRLFAIEFEFVLCNAGGTSEVLGVCEDEARFELTLRALGTGAVIGFVLAPCNIYAGLKIGWAFNMSVAAALVGFGFWRACERGLGASRWGILESNINQTAASSAAAIAGAGLVAPIPAWTLLTGRELALLPLVLWVFTVSAVGVTVALGMRRRLLEVDQLRFPSGVATAKTLEQLVASGPSGLRRVWALGVAAMLSGLLKGASLLAGGFTRWAPVRAAVPGGQGATWANLGFALDPSLLLVGFGAIVGLRAGLSLLLGAVLAWGWLAPWALARGWAEAGPVDPTRSWFGPVVEWLLWPGVALMVVSSLTSFALASFEGRGGSSSGPRASGVVGFRLWTGVLAAVAGGAAAVQYFLFGIPVWVGVLAVGATFLLAVVAGRVAGETGITPIGAMGKVTQLGFAAVSPAQVTTNLMAANVTGGAASQCADMLHDLKTGLLVGARPRAQAVAQMVGILGGSWSGVLAYRLLIPEPSEQLMTPEWPAPAVVTWKAVAELFQKGWDQLPPGALVAMGAGSLVGFVLAVSERRLPDEMRRFVPSPASLGLACVLPAWNSLSMTLGALAAAAAEGTGRVSKEQTTVVAAGLVAGESLVGVAGAFSQMLSQAS